MASQDVLESIRRKLGKVPAKGQDTCVICQEPLDGFEVQAFTPFMQGAGQESITITYTATFSAWIVTEAGLGYLWFYFPGETNEYVDQATMSLPGLGTDEASCTQIGQGQACSSNYGIGSFPPIGSTVVTLVDTITTTSPGALNSLGLIADNFSRPVPEPSLVVLFATGVLGLLGLALPRRKASA